MIKAFRFSALLIILSIIMSAAVMPAIEAEQADTLTVLFTSDMHDSILPAKGEVNGAATTEGGFARLQSAINQEKAKNKNTLLVDAGDFSMGTPYQTIYSSDAPELRLMGKIGYDVVTLGNHEFDYRAEGLAESLDAAKKSGDKIPQMVQSNVVFPEGKDLGKLKRSMDNYGVRDYTIINAGGLKIGVFGLMGKEAASMAPMSGVEFSDAVENAKRVVKILKEQEKVDLILCLSHSGIKDNKSKSEDEILARKVPEIDIIISGHTHTMLAQPIVTGKTIIGSCEDNSKYLGVITVSRKDGGWKLDEYGLRAIDDKLQEDTEIAALADNFKKTVQEKYFSKFNLSYDEIIARAPFSFQNTSEISKNHAESTLGNLISDSYIYAVRAAEGDKYEPVTAAIVPSGTIRGTFYKGDITAADAFNVSSLGVGADKISGYPLISVYLTGKELKTSCEVDASIAPIMSEAQLFMSGIEYTFNPNRLIFNKVTESGLMNPDGSLSQIDDKKLYRVVAGLYSAQMLSVVGEKSFGLMSIVPKTRDGKPVKDFEAQIIYTSGGTKAEVKEWSAIVSYLRSFEKVNGISQVPDYYSKNQGRKIVDNNRNIFAILAHPNTIGLVVYAIAILLTVLIVLIIIKVVKKIRRKNS